jgi:hypothetical protein
MLASCRVAAMANRADPSGWSRMSLCTCCFARREAPIMHPLLPLLIAFAQVVPPQSHRVGSSGAHAREVLFDEPGDGATYAVG